jgi:hypothetical protein
MSDASIDILIKAQDEASARIKEVQNQLSGMSNAAEKSKPSFLGMASAIAAGQAALQGLETIGRDVIGFMKDTIGTTESLALETRTLKAETGMTAEQVTGFVAVLDRYGIGQSQAAMGMKAFAKQIEETANETKKGATAFDDLGISVKDSHGKTKSMNDLIMEVADKFHTMADGAEKTADATKLFGRSAANIIPLLNQGSGAIKEMEDEAKKMGLVLTEDNIGAMQNYIQSQKKMEEAITGLKLQIGNALMPVFTNMATSLSNWAANPSVQNAIHQIADEVGKLAKDMADWVNNVAIPWVKDHWPTIKKVIQDTWDVVKGIANFIQGPFGQALIIAGGIILAVVGAVKVWTAAQTLLNAALDANPIDLIIIAIALLIGIVVECIKHWKEISGALENAWNWFKKLPEPIKAILSPIGFLVDHLKDLKKVFQDVKNIGGAAEKAIEKVFGFKGAAGGLVTSTGIYAADGWFQPQGTDTVPAMLTPGERVLTVEQNKAFEQGKLGGMVINIYGNINNPNGYTPEEIAEIINRKMILAQQGAF